MRLEGGPHYGGAGGGVVEAAGRQVAEVAAETSAKNSSVDNVLGTSKCRRLCPRVCVCVCAFANGYPYLCFCVSFVSLLALKLKGVTVMSVVNLQCKCQKVAAAVVVVVVGFKIDNSRCCCCSSNIHSWLN